MSSVSPRLQNFHLIELLTSKYSWHLCFCYLRLPYSIILCFLSVIKNFAYEILWEWALYFGTSHDHNYHKWTIIAVKATDYWVTYILGTLISTLYKASRLMFSKTSKWDFITLFHWSVSWDWEKQVERGRNG